MLVCLVHGYILFLKLRHMCDGLVKFDPIVDLNITSNAYLATNRNDHSHIKVYSNDQWQLTGVHSYRTDRTGSSIIIACAGVGCVVTVYYNRW